MEGGELKTALWTMALLLFLMSLLFIFLIHFFSGKNPEKAGEKSAKRAASEEKKTETGNQVRAMEQEKAQNMAGSRVMEGGK